MQEGARLPPKEAPSIRKLETNVINRIAAGEVVQRPSSAIKELIENSLDAGSTSITITVKNGGLDLLQIADNGHGIRKEDLAIVCERFTTSKLRHYDDLQSIQTFGFRGEALASITHVAHVTILTRTAQSPCAYRARYRDSQLVPLTASDPRSEPKPCAGVLGTTITVEDLFYNMPTRRQAFRNSSEEYQRILEVATRYSILYADRGVGFVVKKQGQAIPDLHTTSSCRGGVTEVIGQVYGSALARELVNVDFTSSDYHEQSGGTLTEPDLKYRVSGKLTSASYSQRRVGTILFLNHRLVESASIRRVIDNVYCDLLPKHGHPFVFLSIEMDGRCVDVNVHPTKREVHFLYEDAFLAQLAHMLRLVLEGGNQSRVFQVQTLLPAVIQSNESKVKEENRLNAYHTKPALVVEESSGEGVMAESESAVMVDDEGSDREEEETSQQTTDRTNEHHARASSRDLSSFAATYASSSSSSGIPQPLHSQRKRTSDSSGYAPQSSSNAIKRPNKMVRVDPSAQRIDRFFRSPVPAAPSPGSGGLPYTPPVADSPVVSLIDRDGDATETAEESIYCQLCSLPTSSQAYTPSPVVGNVSIDESFALLCTCCKDNTEIPLPTHPLPPSKLLPELNLTRCEYDSIQLLITLWQRGEDGEGMACLRDSSWVGSVDQSYSLLQHGTRLLLCHHKELLRQLFYQLALFRFAELPRYTMTTPLDVFALLSSTEEVPKEEDVRKYVMSLSQQSAMLEEYFSIGFTHDERGNLLLISLPVLLEGHQPQPCLLPLFLLELARGVDYQDEQNCFHQICSVLADYYKHLQLDYSEGEDGGEIVVSVAKEANSLLADLLFPALRKYLVIQRARSGQEVAFCELTSLEKLYRVFERC
eukprot:gene4303-4723_t